MTVTSTDDNDFAELLASLNRVRTALKSGDYASLEAETQQQDLLREKLELRVGAQDLPHVKMQLLQAAASRNQRLIEAARFGIQSAHQRHRDIQETQQNAQTYDRTGRRQKLVQGNDLLEKRS
jgi:hypothetical protein